MCDGNGGCGNEGCLCKGHAKKHEVVETVDEIFGRALAAGLVTKHEMLYAQNPAEALALVDARARQAMVLEQLRKGLIKPRRWKQR